MAFAKLNLSISPNFLLAKIFIFGNVLVRKSLLPNFIENRSLDKKLDRGDNFIPPISEEAKKAHPEKCSLPGYPRSDRP